MKNIDRIWFLTWTTYGTWLPGEERGFVTKQRTLAGRNFIHNRPGTSIDHSVEPLACYSHSLLKQPPVYLTRMHAEQLLPQFLETGNVRNWTLFAVAIMRNHIHLIVGVPGDPIPEKILGDFKSYGSRKLNQVQVDSPPPAWWTQSGSKRKITGENAIRAVVRYIQNQKSPLLTWAHELFENERVLEK
ncbi:MAG: transposase [Pirellulales bacterium]|nr:transposase [Pirellulales bacterium]